MAAPPKAKGSELLTRVYYCCATLTLISLAARGICAAPTSSSAASAAAEAAANAAFGNLLAGGGQSPAPDIKVNPSIAISSTAAPTKTIVVQEHADGSVVSSVLNHKQHRHSGRSINVTDKLHKFDLFIDPVCEQIVKLTEKQLNRVYAQLRQFSSHTSNNALAKCFQDHGFHFDLHSATGNVMSRDQLAQFCSARQVTTDQYRVFTSCAAHSWSPLIETEIDAILKNRIASASGARGKAAAASASGASKDQPLSTAEKSLIDDIVAHLHEEQVEEIASELASEQQQQHSAAAATSASAASPVTAAATVAHAAGSVQLATTHKPLAAAAAQIAKSPVHPIATAKHSPGANPQQLAPPARKTPLANKSPTSASVSAESIASTAAVAAASAIAASAAASAAPSSLAAPVQTGSPRMRVVQKHKSLKKSPSKLKHTAAVGAALDHAAGSSTNGTKGDGRKYKLVRVIKRKKKPVTSASASASGSGSGAAAASAAATATTTTTTTTVTKVAASAAAATGASAHATAGGHASSAKASASASGVHPAGHKAGVHHAPHSAAAASAAVGHAVKSAVGHAHPLSATPTSLHDVNSAKQPASPAGATPAKLAQIGTTTSTTTTSTTTTTTTSTTLRPSVGGGNVIILDPKDGPKSVSVAHNVMFMDPRGGIVHRADSSGLQTTTTRDEPELVKAPAVSKEIIEWMSKERLDRNDMGMKLQSELEAQRYELMLQRQMSAARQMRLAGRLGGNVMRETSLADRLLDTQLLRNNDDLDKQVREREKLRQRVDQIQMAFSGWRGRR